MLARDYAQRGVIKPRQVTDVFGDIGTAMGLEREIVACVGSSSTAARGTYDWIAELGKHPRNARFRFLNFGLGGDLSHNVVRRLDAVAATKPDRVIVLIGSNDILATVFPNFGRFARLFKGSLAEPSPEQFRQNLDHIAIRLRERTKATIALSSLAPVGEDLRSNDPVQRRLNELFAEYNGIIREVSVAHETRYLAFYEAFLDHLARSGTTKSFSRLSFPRLYRDYLFREGIQRRSFDDISRMNGWAFHIDGIHLNSRGGEMLVEVVQQFLDS
jgi:lysophospholipase L1-like esterase